MNPYVHTAFYTFQLLNSLDLMTFYNGSSLNVVIEYEFFSDQIIGTETLLTKLKVNIVMNAAAHARIWYIYLIVYIPFLYCELFLRNLMDYYLNMKDIRNVYCLFFIL